MASNAIFLPQLLISILLFMVLFFGIGFIVNMLLKTSWLPTWIYPIVIILVVEKKPFLDYFSQTKAAFVDLIHHFVLLTPTDCTILISGWIGAIISGVTIKMLRVRGYQMF